MSTYWVAVVAVTSLVVLQGVTGEWRDAPYDEDEDFNTQVRYTDDAVLHCNDSRVGSFNYEVTKWILPNLDIVYPGNESCFANLDGTSCSRVSEDGLDMEIELVQDEHFGLYYCEVEDDLGQEHVVKRGLNYKGAHFGNTWPKYEKAAIWSICWAVIFGVLSGLGGVLYIKKYPGEYDDDEDEEEEEAKDKIDQKDPKSVYENAGYAHGDDTSIPGMTELDDRSRTDTPPPPAAVTVSTVNEEERPTKASMPAVEVPHDESTSF